MAITRLGLTGSMTAYGAFTAKAAAVVLAAIADYIISVRADAAVIQVREDVGIISVREDAGIVTL